LPNPILSLQLPPPFTQQADVGFPDIFNPQPPFSFVFANYFPFYKPIFLLGAAPCQKKVLLCLSRDFTTVLGNKYIDMW
jgi:hypothetical protein